MFRNPLVDAILAVLVLVVIFGPKRLPMIGRSLGEGIKDFRDSISGRSDRDAEDSPALITAQASGSATPDARPTQTSPEQ